MKNFELKLYFKTVILMLCSIIGVGFVSGAEINQFFTKFENFSYIGVIVFGVVLFLLLNKILKQYTYIQNCVKMTFLNKNISNNTILVKSRIKTILVNFNILMISSAMFSGMFLLLKQLFNNNYYFIYLFVCLIIFFILCNGINGLQKFDYLVIVFLIFLIANFVINLSTSSRVSDIKVDDLIVDKKSILSSIVFAGIYVFMNIVQLQSILNELNLKLSKKGRLILSILFSIILSLILFCLILFLNKNSYLKNYDMPFLNYFKSQSKFFQRVFSIGLLFTVLSSLISALFGVKKIMSKIFKLGYTQAFYAMLLSILFSFIGFSNFVSIVYPLIGIINFIIFVFL